MGQFASSFVNQAGNIASTVLTNDANIEIANRNNAASAEQAQLNREFEADQSATGRQFSHDEAQLAREDEWAKMEYNNMYNSPVEQLKRYQEAGLNPAVMMQGQTAQGASVPGASPQATNTGSGVSPQMPIFDTPHLNPVQFMLADPIQDLKTLKEIAAVKANTRKTEAETNQIDTLTDSLLADLEATAEGKRIANNINASYGAKQADAQLAKTIEETAQVSQQIFLFTQEGKTKEAEELLARERARTEKVERGLKKAQRESYHLSNETYFLRLESDLNEAKSRSASNYASAAKSREETTSLRYANMNTKELMEHKEGNMVVHRALAELSEKVLSNEEKRIYNDNYQSILDQTLAKMAQDLEHGDIHEWAYYVDAIKNALSGAASAGISAYGHYAGIKHIYPN